MAAASLRSAGLLAYRRRDAGPEFLLVHPGGPFWTHRDDGAWSIPKGLVDGGEDELAAATREFREEVGLDVAGPFVRLTDRRLRGGKVAACWLVEADLDLANFRSNTFVLEWPPRSGRSREFPECDRAAYFAGVTAASKVLASQRGFIQEAVERLAPQNGR